MAFRLHRLDGPVKAPRRRRGLSKHHILVTGGAGYIGSVLTPRLLELGHRVTVFDWLLFGEEPLAAVADHERFTLVKGDMRDRDAVEALLEGNDFDIVIHLAAMSNDPSADIDEALTKAVNLDALGHIMEASKRHGVGRFLYASSASVYGIKDTPDVTEDLSLEPITLYAKYKAEGERLLAALLDDAFVGVSVRSATVCGYSPRLRLDLTINILTGHAVTRGEIRVFGGDQMRPNVHVQDLVDFYINLIDTPAEVVQGKAFNVTRENATVMGLAELIRDTLGTGVDITIVPTVDHRSYHLSGAKAAAELGWTPKHTLQDAVLEIRDALGDGRIADHDDPIYRNVHYMKLHTEFWQ
jgi:nucleoside-diphosphate-sugar epimerase